MFQSRVQAQSLGLKQHYSGSGGGLASSLVTGEYRTRRTGRSLTWQLDCRWYASQGRKSQGRAGLRPHLTH